MAKKSESGFDARQVEDFVARVKREAGCGWAMLGSRFQEALISERALLVFAGQVCEKVPVAALLALRREMLDVAGLLDARVGVRS
jgi:hypothetical protein